MVHRSFSWGIRYSIAIVFSLGLVLGHCAFGQGSAPMWSTYLGGTEWDGAYDVAADGAGNIYVVGTTESQDFPGAAPPQPWQGNGRDVFVSKFSPYGWVHWTLLLGGTENEGAVGIAVDPAGDICIKGNTHSADLPTPNGWDSSYNGNLDTFVAKISRTGGLLWSTYLGGGSSEGRRYASGGIAVDRYGDICVVGATEASDFPTTNGWDTTHNQGRDGFVAKFDSSGTLRWSTYLGGSAEDEINDVAVDDVGNVYVTGWTDSSDFPVRNGYDSTYGGRLFDAFVAKFDRAGDLVWSTYLGGDHNDLGFGVAPDHERNVYVCGGTISEDFPTLNGWDRVKASVTDVFVAKLNASGSDLLWGTYLGGGSWDGGYTIAVDPVGGVYVGGITQSSDFPTLNGWDSDFYGGSEAFVAKFSEDGSQLLWSTFLGGSHFDRCYGISFGPGPSVIAAIQTQSQNYPTLQAYSSQFGGGESDGAVTRFGEDVVRPSVYNVTAGQRTDGSMIVDVRYDLRADEQSTENVSVQYSPDGVADWTVATHVAGDVGSSVPTGAGKSLTIDAGAEAPGVRWDRCRAKIVASSEGFSNAFTWDTRAVDGSGEDEHEPGDITVRGNLDLLLKLARYPGRVAAYAQDNQDILVDLANPFLSPSQKKQKVETLVANLPQLSVTTADVRDFRQFLRDAAEKGMIVTLIPSGGDIEVSVQGYDSYLISNTSLGFDRVTFSGSASGSCLECEKNGQSFTLSLDPFAEVFVTFQAIGVKMAWEVADPVHVKSETTLFFETPALMPGLSQETQIIDLLGHDVTLTSSVPYARRDMAARVGVGVSVGVEGHAVVGGGASLDVNAYAEASMKDTDPKNLGEAFASYFSQSSGGSIGDALEGILGVLARTSWAAVKAANVGAGFGLSGEGGIGVGGKAGGGVSASADLSAGVSAGFSTPVSVISGLGEDAEEFAEFLGDAASLTHNISAAVLELMPDDRARGWDLGDLLPDEAADLIDGIEEAFDLDLDDLWDDVKDEWKDVVDDLHALQALLGDFWTCFVRSRQLIRDLDLEVLNQTEVGVGFGVGLSGEAEAVVGVSAEVQVGLRAATNLRSLLLFFSLSGWPEMGLVAAFVDTGIGVNVAVVEATYGQGKDIFGIRVAKHGSTRSRSTGDDDWARRIRDSYDRLRDESNPAISVLGNFADTGLDTDGDDSYDALHVEMDVEVEVAGEYSFTGLLFEDTTCIAVDLLRKAYYETGLHRVALDFDGAHFRDRGDGQRFNFGYAITGPGTAIIETDDTIYQTSFYDGDDFDSSAARFGGSCSDAGVDVDGNGLCDVLRVSVEIDADAEQNVTLVGLLEGGDDLRIPALVHLHLEEGITSQALDLPGEGISASGVDGPYTVHLKLLDHRGMPVDTLAGFSTQAFAHGSFERPAACLTDGYYARLRDRDVDGAADELEIRVGVEVTVEGRYILDGFLAAEGMAVPVGFDETLPVGTSIVPVRVDGARLRETGRTQCYELRDLRLRDADDIDLGSRRHAFTTPVYSHSWFDGPGARLTGAYEHFVTDENANGLHDSLTVTVGVTVEDSGTYTVSGCLNCEGPLVGAAVELFFSQGTHHVPLVFDGSAIYEGRSSASYSIEGVSVATGGSVIDHAEAGADLRFFDFAAFEHYPVASALDLY